MKEVFIIGSKGIPARYGGYETFVENLTRRKTCCDINYHIACLGNDNSEKTYNNSRCFNVKVPNIGPAKAIYYDVYAIKNCLMYIKEHNSEKPIVYVLTCRIGPFFKKLVKKIHKLNGIVYLNPDGHEWKRAKWSLPVKKYWKYSEKLMVKYSDLIICDSLNIEKYIQETYKRFQPKTTYIAYGADISKSTLTDKDVKIVDWFSKFGIKSKEYYLVVGRFVPENNFEVIIREFINSKTKKDLVLITNVEKNKLYNVLEKKYHFSQDKRIKFVGTVYDEDLLKKIRELCFAYIHGHSVGGTNPSLLEALASSDLNLLYNVGFNKECGSNSALYFSEKLNDLSNVINNCDKLSLNEINKLKELSTNEIKTRYSWEFIIDKYEKLFTRGE